MKYIPISALVGLLVLAGCAVQQPPTPNLPRPTSTAEASLTIYMSALGGNVVSVGSDIRLSATNSLQKPMAWRVADEDKDKATIQASTDPTLGSVATIRAIKPGGVRVVVEVDGKPAEALIGSLDPSTTSTPVPVPSGFPNQDPNGTAGARVITDNAAWSAFVRELYQGQPGTGGLEASPIDFAARSLVVVITDALPNTATPVVTHVETGATATVHVIQPRNIGYRAPEPGGYMPGVITLLSIPKVSADAKVNFRVLKPTSL